MAKFLGAYLYYNEQGSTTGKRIFLAFEKEGEVVLVKPSPTVFNWLKKGFKDIESLLHTVIGLGEKTWDVGELDERFINISEFVFSIDYIERFDSYTYNLEEIVIASHVTKSIELSLDKRLSIEIVEKYRELNKMATKVEWVDSYEYERRYANKFAKEYKGKFRDTGDDEYEINSKTGDSKMIDTNKVMARNMDAAKAAAQVTAGKGLLKVVKKKVRKQVPMVARGYLDSALGDIVVANLVSYIVTRFAADNENAVWASDAMMVASMSSFMESFDLDGILSEFTKESKKAKKKVKAD